MSRCLVGADGTHPEVDLSQLVSATDHVVQSKSGDKYSFHLNACGETALQNGGCSAGTSICEVEDGATGLDSYGFVDTIALAWDQTNELVMTMTGEEECPFNKAKPYTASIHFTCSQTASGPTLLVEDYYKCNVELGWATPVACGHDAKRYNCNTTTHQCVANSAGSFASGADCLAGCAPAPPPPPPSPPPPTSKFTCNYAAGMCSEDSTGIYPSLTDCAVVCDHPSPSPPPPSGSAYSCSNGNTCIADANGAFHDFSDCQANCAPFMKHYTCYNGQCVRDSKGKFPSEKECTSICGQVPSSTWACANGECTEDTHGTFSSESECQAACATLWYCNWHTEQCEASTHGVADKDLCETVCATSGARRPQRGIAFLRP